MNYFKIMGFLLATMEIVLAYNQHESLSAEELAREMAHAFAKPCLIISKAHDIDLDKLMEGDFPETEAGECFLKCLLEQLSVVGLRKHRNPPTYGLLTENIYAVANMTNIDHASLELIDRITDKCDDVHHKDECKAATLTVKCVYEEVLEIIVELVELSNEK